MNCSAVDAAGNPAPGQLQGDGDGSGKPILSLPANIVAGDRFWRRDGRPPPRRPDHPWTSAGAGHVRRLRAAIFPLGETTVNCSAVNSGGKETQGGFEVTVVDTTAPAQACRRTSSPPRRRSWRHDGRVHLHGDRHRGRRGADARARQPRAASSRPAVDGELLGCRCRRQPGPGQLQGDGDGYNRACAEPAGEHRRKATGPGGATVGIHRHGDGCCGRRSAGHLRTAFGQRLPLGETAVEYSAVDALVTRPRAAFKVTVVDTTAPALNLPADIVLEATGPGGDGSLHRHGDGCRGQFCAGHVLRQPRAASSRSAELTVVLSGDTANSQ